MLRLVTLTSTALLCGSAAFAQATQPLPGGQKGALTVTIEVKGSTIRQSLTNPAVHENWIVQRKAQFRVPLVGLMTTMADAHGGPPPPAMPAGDPSQMEAGAQLAAQVQNAIKNCPEADEECQAAAIQRLMSQNPGQAQATARQMQAGAAPVGMPALDFTRFQTWTSEGSLGCSNGSASIDESMDGTATPDNAGGLWTIDGDRRGELKLPAQAQAAQSCDTQLSFDRVAKTYSIRIGAMNIGIPADYHLQRKGFPKSAPHKLIYGLFEYTDVTFTGNQLSKRGLTGTSAGLDGSVTLPSRKPFQDGSVRVSPQVTTTIQWRFAPS
jgi:hypothetical protein